MHDGWAVTSRWTEEPLVSSADILNFYLKWILRSWCFIILFILFYSRTQGLLETQGQESLIPLLFYSKWPKSQSSLVKRVGNNPPVCKTVFLASPPEVAEVQKSHCRHRSPLQPPPALSLPLCLPLSPPLPLTATSQFLTATDGSVS